MPPGPLRLPEERLLAGVIGLSAAGGIISLYLLYLHFLINANPGQNYCTYTDLLSCDTVLRSPYSSLLGIPAALIGLLGFAAMAGTAFLRLAYMDYPWSTSLRPLLVLMNAAGLGVGAYLFAIEALVLHQYCPFCLAATGTAIAGFPLALLAWKRAAPPARERAVTGRGWARCTECGATVKEKALERHLRRVHALGGKRARAILLEGMTRSIGRARRERERTVVMYAGALAAVFLLLGAGAVAVTRPSGEAPPIPINVPDFSLVTPNGTRVVLSEHIGKRPILLEFFWTKCPHCINMHSTLDRLHTDYGEGIYMFSLGCDSRDNMDEVRKYVAKYNITWPCMPGPGSLQEQYGVNSYPTFFFIGKDGNIAKRLQGEQDYGAMAGALNALL